MLPVYVYTVMIVCTYLSLPTFTRAVSHTRQLYTPPGLLRPLAEKAQVPGAGGEGQGPRAAGAGAGARRCGCVFPRFVWLVGWLGGLGN